jgi:LPXTG-motif cell wall-anchored protein
MTTSRRCQVALASAVSAAALVVGPLLGTQAAYAQPYPPPPPTLELSRTVVPRGGEVSFTGHNFARRQFVTVELQSRPIILGRYRADTTGTVTGTVTIPRRMSLGWHDFRLTARRPFLSATTRLRVTFALGQGPGGNNGGRHHGNDGPGAHRGVGAATHSEHQRAEAGTRSEHRAGLAATGSEQAMTVGGVAAALLATGGGTIMAVRRRRNP